MPHWVSQRIRNHSDQNAATESFLKIWPRLRQVYAVAVAKCPKKQVQKAERTTRITLNTSWLDDTWGGREKWLGPDFEVRRGNPAVNTGHGVDISLDSV